MPENKQFFIRVDGQLVPVTEEVYREYHKMKHRELYLIERDAAHGTVLYSEMDTDEMTGEDTIPDINAKSVEQTVVDGIMSEKLRGSLNLLSDNERKLIDDLFFSNDGAGMSEREYSIVSGIPQKTINDRKNRILAKLKKLLEK